MLLLTMMLLGDETKVAGIGGCVPVVAAGGSSLWCNGPCADLVPLLYLILVAGH
jgi:hypothetical protein